MTAPAEPSAPSLPPVRGRRTRWVCVLYLLGIVGVAACFRLIGERAWWLWTPLLLPMAFWLLPMLVLTPLAWKRDRRMLGVLAGAALVILWMSGWQWSFRFHKSPEAADSRTLRVISYNIGENNKTSVLPFVDQLQPDLLLIQCTGFASSKYRPYQPVSGAKVHHRSIGRFDLQSLHPITHAELLRHPAFSAPYGALFRVQCGGETVSVFSIHMETPRLAYMKLTGIRAPKKPLPERARLFRSTLKRRGQVVDALLARVRSTPGPVIMAGDFNMPAWGYFYPRFRSELTDSFHEVGRGFGYTFPAYDPYFPTFIGPWLRLDYVFSNDAFRPVAFEVERSRPSQHRAVCATLLFAPEPVSKP